MNRWPRDIHSPWQCTGFVLWDHFQPSRGLWNDKRGLEGRVRDVLIIDLRKTMARELALIFLSCCFLWWRWLLLLLLLHECCCRDGVGLQSLSLSLSPWHRTLVCHKAPAIVTWWLILVLCCNWITGVNHWQNVVYVYRAYNNLHLSLFMS